MGKTAGRQTFSDKIFGFLRDWMSQSRVEVRLIMENVRLRKEVGRLQREREVLLGTIHQDTEEAYRVINERNGEIVELRKQIDHLNGLLFECRGKSDAAERSDS